MNRLDTWLLNEARATGSPSIPATRIYQYGPGCMRDNRDLKATLATLTERGRAPLGQMMARTSSIMTSLTALVPLARTIDLPK